MQMAHPMALRPEMFSLKTMADPTMTTTRLAVLATDWVTAEICSMRHSVQQDVFHATC